MSGGEFLLVLVAHSASAQDVRGLQEGERLGAPPGGSQPPSHRLQHWPPRSSSRDRSARQHLACCGGSASSGPPDPPRSRPGCHQTTALWNDQSPPASHPAEGCPGRPVQSRHGRHGRWGRSPTGSSSGSSGLRSGAGGHGLGSSTRQGDPGPLSSGTGWQSRTPSYSYSPDNEGFSTGPMPPDLPDSQEERRKANYPDGVP